MAAVHEGVCRVPPMSPLAGHVAGQRSVAQEGGGTQWMPVAGAAQEALAPYAQRRPPVRLQPPADPSPP